MPRMPTIPTAAALGDPRVNGRATPAEINPNVAYDIGRAGAAWDKAFDQIAAAFGSLGAKKQAQDDATWLAESKIATLTADDEIRRQTELNAGEDGTGFEQAPIQFKSSVEEIEKKPGGSPDARAKFKLWSAEQGFETGRWAASSAQKRLRESSMGRLDKRLDELDTLTQQNPDKAMEYFSAYSDEASGMVGSAITATDAHDRVEMARGRILKSAVVAKSVKNPTDLGKAVRALSAAEQTFTQQNPELRARPTVTGAGPRSIAGITYRLETGTDDPIKGVKSVRKDAGGTWSYGNFGINSSGSAQQFKNRYGAQFGLTAKPGTAEFNEQWKNAAGAAPVELHAAEQKWWNDTIGSKVTNALVRAGLPSDMANDPRVMAYFSDRMVQYGPNSTANHANRVAAAYEKSGGDIGKFLSDMSRQDRSHIQSDFPTALSSGQYSTKAHNNRVAGRERGALSVTRGQADERPAFARTMDPKNAPTVDGSIQPAEILSLSPEDYRAVTRELRPYMVEEAKQKMSDALSALQSKGKQDVISDADIDNYEPFIGPKAAEEFRSALREAEDLHYIQKEAVQMSPAQRTAKLSELVPTGNPEDLAGEDRVRFDQWQKSIAAINQQLQKDPLGFVTQNNESGRQAMKNIAAAPENANGTAARERAFDVLLKIQRENGVPLHKQRVLSEGTASQMAQDLMDTKSGAVVSQKIESLRQTYGKHIDKVWGELVDAGAPTSYLALTTSTPAGQEALAQSYALEKASSEAAGKDRSNILTERAGVKKADLQKAITEEISDFTSTMRSGFFGGERLIQSYRDAVERVALYNMIVSGKSLNEAVRGAAGEIYGKNVEIVNQVPVSREVLAQGGQPLRLSLSDARPFVMDSITDRIDPNMIERPMYGPGYSQERYIDSLRANGTYFPSADGEGVYIRDEFGRFVMEKQPGPEQGLRPQLPIFLSWGELTSIGKGSLSKMYHTR